MISASIAAPGVLSPSRRNASEKVGNLRSVGRATNVQPADWCHHHKQRASLCGMEWLPVFRCRRETDSGHWLTAGPLLRCLAERVHCDQRGIEIAVVIPFNCMARP